MGKRKAPYLKPPARPMLQSLPPELLHHICQYLDLPEVLAARATCSILAAVGIDYFGDEVPLVHHPDKFKALEEISTHPILAGRMRSLFYVCDRVQHSDILVWDRRGPEKPGVVDLFAPKDADDPAQTTMREHRAAIRDVDRSLKEARQRRNAVPLDDRYTAFDIFEALCQESRVTPAWTQRRGS